ncbi:MAG TPA: MoaD/ThiS family protein [Anaerovoracaceae bacterium]|nr:MoaD/ThiS family protein [Anaerovoracaceae bacterium]
MVVKYFAYFRNFAGRKEESLLLGPITAIELLKELCRLHGSALKNGLLTENGEEIHPDVIFLIDGRNIDFLAGKDSVVNQDAVVSLFPRIAGG